MFIEYSYRPALYLVYRYFVCFPLFVFLAFNSSYLCLPMMRMVIVPGYLSIALCFVYSYLHVFRLFEVGLVNFITDLFCLQLHACVGSSLGGMLSLMAAAEFPERVGRSVEHVLYHVIQ